ncbi:hypothetical protein BGX31_007141 [Mortierella sp. GBA43]|nr:hypothetical protein BGX31_007141 [Mortierella sp. GBA43]
MDPTEPRTNYPRTGLRRPNYGLMQRHTPQKFSSASHVARRRIVVDENLFETLHQTHFGVDVNTGINSGRNSIGTHNGGRNSIGNHNGGNFINSSQESVESEGEIQPIENPVGTSNQHLKATPLKALADANQARVNKLISEANRRGRAGRDRHSPMGILKMLSRIPGFNPPPPPVPDREPIPGSSNWRKLTPKSQRTTFIQIPDDLSNPFSDSSIRDGSLSIGRNSYSSNISKGRLSGFPSAEELRGDDITRLWEDQMDQTRSTFGLLEDGDTRELNIIQGDIADPFIDSAAVRDGPSYIGDITITSQRGFEQNQAQQGQEQRQHQEGANPDSLQVTPVMDENGYLDVSVTSNSMSLLTSGSSASKVQGQLMRQEVIMMDGTVVDLQQEQLDIDMEDGWEDIPDNELTGHGEQQHGSDQQQHDSDQQQQRQHNDGPMLDDMPTDREVTAEDDEMNRVSQDPVDEIVDSGNQATMDEVPQDEGGLDVNAEMNDEQQTPTEESLREKSQDLVMEDQQEQDSEQVDEVTNDQDQMQPDEVLDDQAPAPEEDLQQGYEDDYMNANGEDRVEETEQDEQRDNEDGYANDEEHIEQAEYDGRHGESGVNFFDDFPSELGIMSNGEVLPTSAPAPKKVVKLSRTGIPVPSMPPPLQKQLVRTFSRARISREAMAVIMEGSHLFFEQAASDLAAYAQHAGRRIIDESDVECLMERLRITNDKVSMESLLQRYLPRELRDKVLYPDDIQYFRRR